MKYPIGFQIRKQMENSNVVGDYVTITIVEYCIDNTYRASIEYNLPQRVDSNFTATYDDVDFDRWMSKGWKLVREFRPVTLDEDLFIL